VACSIRMQRQGQFAHTLLDIRLDARRRLQIGLTNKVRPEQEYVLLRILLFGLVS